MLQVQKYPPVWCMRWYLSVAVSVNKWEQPRVSDTRGHMCLVVLPIGLLFRSLFHRRSFCRSTSFWYTKNCTIPLKYLLIGCSTSHTPQSSNTGRENIYFTTFFSNISFGQQVIRQDGRRYCFQRNHLKQSTTEHFTYVAIQIWIRYSCRVKGSKKFWSVFAVYTIQTVKSTHWSGA
jgi:hypothetical protein